MRLSLDSLGDHLRGATTLAPVYLVAGDEPLLVGEAADAIRARARELGHTEREVHFVDRGTDWNAIRAASGSMSLFGERRILELRLGGKAGKDGGAAIAALCESPAPDTLLLIIGERIDRDGQATAWFKAAERQGVWVPVDTVGVAWAQPAAQERTSATRRRRREERMVGRGYTRGVGGWIQGREGPFGAKGCGEGAFAGIIGAIATAVADAGVPMTELPITPERVWKRIRETQPG